MQYGSAVLLCMILQRTGVRLRYRAKTPVLKHGNNPDTQFWASEESTSVSCECEVEVRDAEQAKVLKALLAINAAMFFVESITGLFAESTGLIADSLDMFADAAVYGIGLYAVGRSTLHKARAAYASGIFQCLLGAGVVVEVVHRFIVGSEPISLLMMSIGTLALVANVTCLVLLSKHREGEVHMRASWIFSTNDVLANLGVILAGVLVAYLGSALPDLVIGSVISALVIRGGVRIILDARHELAEDAQSGNRGFLTPSPHTTRHAGPHRAVRQA
jgi:Co/Zn/Cd efflux system component